MPPTTNILGNSVGRLLAPAVLVSGILYPPIAPYHAVYIVLAGLIFSLIFYAPYKLSEICDPTYFPLAFAFVILFATSVLSAGRYQDLAALYILSPLLCAPAVDFLLQKQPEMKSSIVLASLCLIASFCALAIGLNDVVINHAHRAEGFNNAIHFAGISLILGFMSLIGVPALQSSWRLIFVLGPVFGTITVFLTGSRGPTLAAAGLILITLAILSVWYWKDKVFRSCIFILVAAPIGVLSTGNSATIDRARSGFIELAQLFQLGNASNAVPDVRIPLYEAVLTTFAERPIWGHGISNMMPAVAQNISEQYAYVTTNNHLHSDVSDFAILGGTFGLAAYLSLLLAPMWILTIKTDETTRRIVLIGGIILSTGYFLLGLTNAMFGILPQTAMYGLFLGLLGNIARNGKVSEEA